MATLQSPGQIAAVLKQKQASVNRKKQLLKEEQAEEAQASLRFHKMDANRDGVVDMDEYIDEAKKSKKEEAIAHKVTADGTPEDLTGKDMISKLEEKLRSARANRYNYLNLFYFLCYVGLYLFVLTEQRSTLRSFQVEEALKISLFSETTNTLELYSGEISENLDSVKHIWSWINKSLIHSVFTDPICGDGTCDVPQEFQQWESYGCAEDCGSVPRSKMTNLFVEVTAHFETDAEVAAASWNLCSQTHALCFYPTARKFATRNETQLVEMWLPDGVWELAVDAQNGGVSGRVYLENTTVVTYYRNVTSGSSTSNSSSTNSSQTGGGNSTNGSRRLVEMRQLTILNGTNSSNATLYNQSSSFNATNNTYHFMNNSNASATAPSNSSNATISPYHNSTGTNSSNATISPYHNSTGTSNSSNVSAPVNISNNTTTNTSSGGASSSSNSSSSSPTNTSSNLVLVTEVVKVQTNIVSWSVCKDSSDSSVDFIVEYVNRTILPKCAEAGIFYELCGTGDRCPRCFNEFDCWSQPGCAWDITASQCYDRVCANSELQCQECADQAACEGVGCLYDSYDGCLPGCNDCAQCPEPSCRLMSNCFWDGMDQECYDQPCGQFDCGGCDQGRCGDFPGWCEWNSAMQTCEHLYCESGHCGRPMCFEPGECSITPGCTWDAGSGTCSQGKIFLPLAETIVPVQAAVFEEVQGDLGLLNGINGGIKANFAISYPVIANHAEDVIIESTLIVTEVVTATLSVPTGFTITGTDLEEYRDALQRTRCGKLFEHLCRVEHVIELNRRRLEDRDLEFMLSIFVSQEYVSEVNRLDTQDHPLPLNAPNFLTELQFEITGIPNMFSDVGVDYDVTLLAKTQLEERTKKVNLIEKLAIAVGEAALFENGLALITGVSSAVIGPINVDRCANRDCSGHGMCTAGVCQCDQDWEEFQCNYFLGDFVPSTDTTGTGGTSATDSPTTLLPTESPTYFDPGNTNDTLHNDSFHNDSFHNDTFHNDSFYNDTFHDDNHSAVDTSQPSTSPTFSPVVSGSNSSGAHNESGSGGGGYPPVLGEPVATLWIDLEPMVVLESQVKVKITDGLWVALRKEPAIDNNAVAVEAIVDVELSRSFAFAAPNGFSITSHDIILLDALRAAICGDIGVEHCDVTYPSPGFPEVAVTVWYAEDDFDDPPVFPNETVFFDRLENELQAASATVPTTGYVFFEENLYAGVTARIYVVNATESVLFMHKVQSAAQDHPVIILDIKGELGWTGPLLAATGTVNTDLCHDRLCSGNGYCSSGDCVCNTGFFGLSCGFGSRRLQSQCSATVECAFCYDPTDCDALPLCMYDWGNELCVEAGSTAYEEDVQFTPECAENSAYMCQYEFIRNGWCDNACNIPSCGYDGGDCADTANLLNFVCSDFCYCNMLNDQMCNPECNNALCGFDLGDCCVKTFTKRLTREFELWKSSTPETVERLTPDPAVPRLRYLATTNRLIAGILLNQKRKSMKNCTEDRFENLSKSGCFAEDWSEDPYGADPVFLRGTSLTDESLNKLAFYDVNDPTEVSPLGVPYGFHHVTIEGFEKDAGFPLFFDVNFGYQKGQDILNYGREGFYLDDQTSMVTLQAVTYNPHFKLFASIEIKLEFETGGRIRMRYDVQSIRVDMYSTPRDQRRLVAELIFVAATLLDVLIEVKELICRKRGGVSIASYFTSIWNYIDAVNILLMLYLSFTWFNFQTKEFAAFSPVERFEVYSNIDADARFLQFNEEEMKRMLVFFSDTKKLSTLLSDYVTGSACALVLLIMRILKVLDFQERMGIVTRTITNAAVDLFHWLILFGLIFFLYVYMGFLIFGTAILSFSTVERSFQTCFGILLGEIGVTEEMFNLPNRASVYIFYYTFIMIVFFVLINVFLAIIVDAYVDVKNKAENSESLPTEVVLLSRSLLKSFPGLRMSGKRYLSDSEIVKILDEWLREERNLMAIPEPQGSLDIDGYHLRHEVLRGALAKEIAKLKAMQKTSETTGVPMKRRKSAALVDVLTQQVAEKSAIDELSEKIADNIIHRYGQGFRRRRVGGSSRKVQPSLFSKGSAGKYDIPLVSQSDEPPPKEEGDKKAEEQGNEKVDVMLSSLRQAARNEESLDSLDKLIEKDDLKLE